MRVCILLLFTYKNSIEDDNRIKLPGIEIDLYISYKFALKMNPDKIIVITDIIDELCVSSILNPVLKGVVNSDIFTIISTLKKNNQYWNYTNKYDMINIIKKYILESDELFIYYSGHGLNNKFVLPLYVKNKLCDKNIIDNNDNYYHTNDFIINIIDNTNNKCEILLLIDCCQLTEILLPFKMNNNIYRINLTSERNYPSQKIICFTSSHYNEDVLISSNGSLFTKYFFKYMNEFNNGHIFDKVKKYHISNILNTLTKECELIFDQTPSVYSSYPDLKLIWFWLIGKNKKFNIEFDFVKNICTISKK